MDSLPFTRICFLLLTISSAILATTVPSGDPADWTKDSSLSSTKVTAYDCTHCGISVCELSNFSCCVVIGETQNKMFSNEVIQLVTSETHITMCFQQADTFPKGIYAIIWVKDEGIGDSCGILKAEASPENREDIIVTEWKEACCTAEVQLAVPSSSLSCHTELPDKKDKNTLLPVSADGNAINSSSPSVSKRGTFGITTTFVALVGCAVVLVVYCILKKRNRKGLLTVHNHIFIGGDTADAADPEMENFNVI
ncbi:uncharacterized protein LOC112985325 isoform X2 [Dromaius novaehollandiae]|uniref:uncharacterized protein LOC112985325 isoform X2 n=1 Tax=Dromaius novaehollandiae TaxID=8790 RepID=UPI00311D3237